MFPVVPLKVTALLVVALLVEAFDVIKFDDDPNNVAIVPLDATRFVNVEEITVKMFEKKLVLVELVIVASLKLTPDIERFATERFVTVAEEMVAFVANKLFVFVVVAYVVDAYKILDKVLPFRTSVSVAFIRETVAVVDERLKNPEFPESSEYVVVELFIALESTHFGETKTSIVPGVPEV
jgi:hypothetical protein